MHPTLRRKKRTESPPTPNDDNNPSDPLAAFLEEESAYLVDRRARDFAMIWG